MTDTPEIAAIREYMAAQDAPDDGRSSGPLARIRRAHKVASSDDAIVAETVQMLAELRAKLDAAAEARDAKLASIEAGVTALAEERDRLASENARLRRALEPFGAAAAAYDPVEADDAEEAFVTRFTIGLLRAARAALTTALTDGDDNGQ